MAADGGVVWGEGLFFWTGINYRYYFLESHDRLFLESHDSTDATTLQFEPCTTRFLESKCQVHSNIVCYIICFFILATF
jgi:hypothetical protein